MKPAPWTHLDQYRMKEGPFASPDGADFGAFRIPAPSGAVMRCIVSSAEVEPELPWDHLSVSLPHRCQTWEEMDFLKRLFFQDGEWAMQLHAPVQQHINVHPYCLHIWRPRDIRIPVPPSIMV